VLLLGMFHLYLHFFFLGEKESQLVIELAVVELEDTGEGDFLRFASSCLLR